MKRQVDGEKMFEIAFERSQNWYNLLANQRMMLMNFFLLILAANFALIGTAFEKSNPLLFLLTSVELLVISIVFKLLDRRTAEMIKICELALIQLESHIVKETGIAEMALIDGHNVKKTLSYRILFNIIFTLGVCLGIVAFAAFVSIWIRTH